jgi:hypothetical protein
MRINSKDLDAWARTLGASNDADAIATLRRDRIGVLTHAGRLTLMLHRYFTAGADRDDEVMIALQKGAAGALAASQALERLQRAFERHERGVA